MSTPRPDFTLSLATALHRPVGQTRAYYTRDEARAAVAYAFNRDNFGLGDAPHYATITHPDGTRETMEFGRAGVADPEARRAKLLRFVKLYDETDPRHQFRPMLGRTAMRWECLTDAALEDVSFDMVREFWADKRLKRQNRVGRARWLAGQAQLQAAE